MNENKLTFRNGIVRLGGRIIAFDDVYILSAHIPVVPILMLWAVPYPVLLTMIEWRNDIGGDELGLFRRPIIAKEERVVLNTGY